MWWRNAVIYEIYVRSFADSNGDGIGDIPGIVGRLDYLSWLGVDAVWLTPIMTSPGHDLGYDVSGYLDVDPVLGTLADVDRLVAEAADRGIRVLLDLVPNHTSIEHPWFRDPETRKRYYVWSDRPNNWLSTFHIPSWTFHEQEGRYYLHSYLPEQPDLNWWHPEVRDHFDEILGFWFDRGIAGFRIDACYAIVKDQLLRDNPPAGPADHPWDRNRGQRPVRSAHQPQVHDVLRRWRLVAEKYDPCRLLMGATWVPEAGELAAYYGAGDELHLPQYPQLLFTPFEPRELCRVVEEWLAAVPDGETPVWLASSHDFSRFPSRWCDENEPLIRTALSMLLGLPGACVLYQGDEIGLADTPMPARRIRDPTGLCRDTYRAPMPWCDAPGGGFTTGRPWLPLADPPLRNVADQRRDQDSTLQHTRRLIAAKKTLTGPYRRREVSGHHWAFTRGDSLVELDFGPARPLGPGPARVTR
ncbi:alpha-amylase family glycosyl hydrolase [Amycolatopsis sp. NPDC059021]|uniref:alpha-amylase family glycosyl hydrolase n=1 Tax=Amycolatopsis sp. NPDC059021 TaxID=3346704 RepID=UPI00366B0D1B